MRFMTSLPLVFFLAGCGALSERVTETTGMTLAERCAYYRGIAGTLDMRSGEGELSDTEQAALTFAKEFLAGCPGAGTDAPPSVSGAGHPAVSG